MASTKDNETSEASPWQRFIPNLQRWYSEPQPKTQSETEHEIPWAWVRAVQDILEEEPWAPKNNTLPVQLLPWLWLSDQHNTRKITKMSEMGITHVLTTNAMSKSQLESIRGKLNRAGLQHYAVRGHDEEGYDMIGNHWEDCLAILRSVRESSQAKKKKESREQIVVHCAAGSNRSGLIACAAVMVRERRPVLEVVRDVKNLRGMLLTNESFQRQLCQLAAREGLLGAKPEGYSDEPLEVRQAPPPASSALDKLAF
jgi:protein-tyrosine phosphatase